MDAPTFNVIPLLALNLIVAFLPYPWYENKTTKSQE